MKKKVPYRDLDEVDLAILRDLQDDGRLSNAKLAERLSLSETPSWRRLKRLEEEGYIEGYQANLNRRKLGFGVLAFVQLNFFSHNAKDFAEFTQTIQACPEVLACHQMTGQTDYLLQVVFEDLDAYRLFIDRVLRNLSGVSTINTSLSLREIKLSNRLPI
ncbi:MAG TPA: Lrp/AsnC family transcriptional regulator [Burkholderiaceae bacterium]|nr:Lrp/AsnC family transcriptional regulator [Burkholderiaceae bacterium]